MPVQDGVGIVKQSITHHEGLRRSPLLGRAAVITDRPFDLSRLDPLGTTAIAAIADATPNR
jgi:hypothetical protein